MRGTYTPSDVLKLKKPTVNYLCPLSSNTFDVQFLQFKIRDTSTNKIIFETSAEEVTRDAINQGITDEDDLRCIKYQFSREVLKSPALGTTLIFSVGDKPLQNFRMIERHYFKDRLLKTFDFNFNFCIPNSTNSWECIYNMPALSSQEIEDIVAHPYEVVSDSFYFVNDKMIMHNKAMYKYT